MNKHKKNRFLLSFLSLAFCAISFSTSKRITSVAFIFSVIILSSALIYPLQKESSTIHAQIQDQQQQQGKGEQSTSRIYGCADFGQLFHCDPFLNELVTYEMIGNWSIISPVLNDNPRYVEIGKERQNDTQGTDQQTHTNKALELADKSRDFVQIDNNDAYNSEQFSVSFNIYKTSSSSVGQVISHVSQDRISGWFFNIFPPEASSSQDPSKITTGHKLSFGVSKSSGVSTTTKQVPISKSTNIVGTFDGNSVKLYTDGSLFDSAEYEGNYTSDPKVPIHIGSGAYCDSCNRWAGVIDDIRIYNKTLSQDEIRRTILNTGIPRPSPSSSDTSSGHLAGSHNATSSLLNDSGSAGLVGHWPLDGNLHDVSGQDNNGEFFTPLGSMAFTPDGRLFYSEKNTGEIRVLKENKTLPNPFATVRDVYADWEQGLLGIAIDPQYQSNRYVYAYYTAINDQSDSPFNRLVRFTDYDNTGTDMRVLLDNIPASRGFHSGGALTFGPDDKLYVTVGDATEHEYAQDPSIPLGKTLRINRDGTIPNDNPYPNSPVYTLGHRNTFGIAFDSSTGLGILTENGDQAYDEVNLIEKGGNYGFPLYQPANVAPELSNSSESIKPLRSYYQTVAPTQALYYTGDKYPFLTGKFLFGTYTGSIYALTIQDLGPKKQLIGEDHIRLRIHPFDSVNGIAASPTGDIYFGGYYIYKLDVVDVARKRQDTFPVVLTSSPDITIKDVQGSNDADYLYAIVSKNTNNNNKIPSSTNQTSSSFVSLKIPTRFLPGILSVTYTAADGEKRPLNFTYDDSNRAYNLARLEIPQNITDTQLFITGSGARTSAIDLENIDLYDDFENMTYTFGDGQISPDNKWLNVDSGQGSIGVSSDANNTENNMLLIYPKMSKSSAETHSSFVTTTRNFSNFDMSVDLNTVNQTRENAPPKPWETTWIYFRYTDDFHYYWFVLKPTGIELGKKDCDTCTDPLEGQVFLYTDEIPALKLGEWSNVNIRAIGNNITVAVNGTEVVDFADDTMSPTLANGSVGIYAEDAIAAVDNFRIEEILSSK